MKSYVAKSKSYYPYRVQAGVIVAAEFKQDGSGKLYVKGLENSRTLWLVGPGFKRPNTKPSMNADGGDYFILYDHDVKGWMPAERFESYYVPEEIADADRQEARAGNRLLGEIVADRAVAAQAAEADTKAVEATDQTIARMTREAEEERAAIALTHSRRYVDKWEMREAFQVTEATRSSNVTWPAWLHEAWNKHPEAVGSVHPSKYHLSDGHDTLKVIMASTMIEGSPNRKAVMWADYIVRDAYGKLAVWDKENFEQRYVPVQSDQLPAPATVNEETTTG